MSTLAELLAQWTNPGGLPALAMLTGGEIVHNALAQSTGPLFTPACFSFGWVAYSFSALSRVFGDGRLLPSPDIGPVKVFDLSAGTVRSNESWVVGRLMRDLEARVSREYPMFHDGIRITVFEATKRTRKGRNHLPYSRVHLLTLLVVLVQLAVAVLPWAGISGSHDQEGDWAVFLITASGIFTGSWFSSLRQWEAEKLPERQNSKASYALTHGRGFKDVVVILGVGHCLDLDELAAAESPRNWRLWRKFQSLKPPVAGSTVEPRAIQLRSPSFSTRVCTLLGEPLQLWLIRFAALVHAMSWLVILIAIAGMQRNLWYMLGISTLGTVANVVIGALETPLNARLLPLRCRNIIIEDNVIDGIRTFESLYEGGGLLLAEFALTGKLQQTEESAYRTPSTTPEWQPRVSRAITGPQASGEKERTRTFSPDSSSSESETTPGVLSPVLRQDRRTSLCGNRSHSLDTSGRLETVIEQHETNSPVNKFNSGVASVDGCEGKAD